MKYSRRKQFRKFRKSRNSRRMGGMLKAFFRAATPKAPMTELDDDIESQILVESEEERKLNDLSLSVEEHIKVWEKLNPFGPTTKHWEPSTYDNGAWEYRALLHREKIRFYLKKLRAIRQAGSDEMIDDPDPRLEPYTAKLNPREEELLS
jgi:predicted DNA binding protein